MTVLPYFSVAIPLYNKEKYIAATLKSVLSQSFSNFEVVIMDDGSTDNSTSIVNGFNDERIKLFTQDNAGASAARNAAIEKCSGNYIAVLDADDLWEQNHLKNLKELILLFPKAIMYCSNYQLKKENGVYIPAQFSFDYDDKPLLINDFFAGMKKFGISSSSSTVFRKKDFIKVGGYDEMIKSGQDTDLWIRLGMLGKVAFHPLITMTYNSFDNSSLSSSNLYKARAKMLEKYQAQETDNQSLHQFMDLNRYAVAIAAKLSGDIDFFKKTAKRIDKDNLNSKQHLLLLLPSIVLRSLQNFQTFLIKKGIYITAYQ